jgi:hypothetical protein
MWDFLDMRLEKVAYKYGIEYDGEHISWYPWDTSILPAEMKDISQPKLGVYYIKRLT